MFHKEVNGYSLAAWLFAAMTAPLCQLAGKCSWPTALIMIAVFGLLCWCLQMLPWRWLLKKKWFCAVQILWITVLTAELTGWSSEAWPTGTDFPVVPLTLLALAVLAALHGAAGASRTSSVLFWFVVLLYAVVLAAGGQNLNAEYLMPRWSLPGQELVLVLLLPTIAGFLPSQSNKHAWLPFVSSGVFFLAVTLFAEGALSIPICREVTWPFYEAAKSLSLFGVAERFEAFVSVTMTIGYFSLYSLLISAAGFLSENIHAGWGRKGVILSGIAAGVLMICRWELSPAWLVIITLITGAVTPLFGGFVGITKKQKKSKNNA